MKTITVILGLIFISLNVQAQKVITVDNRANTGADYSSLQDAVAAAFVGDTIQIYPSSINYSNITVGKRLVFVGMGHNPNNSTENQRSSVNIITFNGNSANSVVTGLEVTTINCAAGSDMTGIQIKNNFILGSVIGVNGPTSDNWLIEGNIFETGTTQPQINTNGWIIKNNIFDNASQQVLVSANNQTSFLNNLVISSTGNFAQNCTDPLVNNNIFVLEGSTTEVKLTSSTVTFNNCLTRNVSALTVTALSGSNNLDNTDPGFAFTFANIADYYNNDYNVTGAAVNAGTDGTDLGIFGANFSFDVNGRPDDFPYMTSLDISNSSVPMGQNINVTFTAAKKN